MNQTEKNIYRVFNHKGKYQQSYSSDLEDSEKWAIDCAKLVNGFVKKDYINKDGETDKSLTIYPKNKND